MNNEVSLVVNLTDFLKRLILEIIKTNAVEIRNVDAGEEPFLYASGWRGPGYVMIKGLVSWPVLFKRLMNLLAMKVASKGAKVDFVVGNVTGGVIPGYLLSRYLGRILGKEIPFMWIKGTRLEDDSADFPIFVTNNEILEEVAKRLAIQILNANLNFQFVAGAAPGGMALAFRLSEILSIMTGRTIPFVYVRDVRKKGGHKEMITGAAKNPLIKKGYSAIAIGDVDNFAESTDIISKVLRDEGYFSVEFVKKLLNPSEVNRIAEVQIPLSASSIKKGASGIVTEELVNFSKSTSQSVNIFRKLGYIVDHTGTILYYTNPEAIKSAEEDKYDPTFLFTLRQALGVAAEHETHPQSSIQGYLDFLRSPIDWNKARGYEKVEKGGTK